MAKLLKKWRAGTTLQSAVSKPYRRSKSKSRVGRNFKTTFTIFCLSLLLESIALQVITSSQNSAPATGQVASVQTSTSGSFTPPSPTATPLPTRLPIFQVAVQAASQPTPSPTPAPPPPFRVPLNSYVTTQYFSRYHTAVDLAAPYGTPIYSTTQGTVLATGYLIAGGGLMVQISHRDGYVSYYAHLSSIQTSRGASVDRSTQIGRIGTSGWSTGPHLHFMLQRNGQFVNPFSVTK